MGVTSKNEDGSYTTTRELTTQDFGFMVFLIRALIVAILISILIKIWNQDHPLESEHHFAAWSSLVLELPPKTRDFVEWKGDTYCLIDVDWHQCEPRITNITPEGDK